MRQGTEDWAKLADALDRLRAGERNTDALLDGLGWHSGLIVETILQTLADPARLEALQAD